MSRQPLYPHVPKGRVTKPKEIELRFLPDSPEFLTQTVNNTGLRARLESVFHAAIARARGVKS